MKGQIELQQNISTTRRNSSVTLHSVKHLISTLQLQSSAMSFYFYTICSEGEGGRQPLSWEMIN